MKAHYKLFLSLAIGSFVTFAGCQDDEVVDSSISKKSAKCHALRRRKRK